MRWQDKNLFDAVCGDDLPGVRAALDAGAQANITDDNDRSPLWYAVGQVPEMIATLLAQGADPNFADERGYTPLMHAIAEFDFAAAEAMLRHGGDMLRQAQPAGLSALHSAVFADLRDGGTRRVAFAVCQAAHFDTVMHWDGQDLTPEALVRHLSRQDRPAGEKLLRVFADEKERRHQQSVALQAEARAAGQALHQRLLRQSRSHGGKLRL